MQQKLLDSKILTVKNTQVVLNPHWELYAQIHRQVWQQFRDQYDWCDGGVREQIFCLLNNIDEPTGCKRCNKFVSFNIHRNRYNDYCSKQCVHSVGGDVKISVASATLM